MILRFELQCSFEQSNYVTQPFMIYRGAWHILDLPFSYDNNCYSIFFVLIQLLYVSNFVLFVCPTTNDKLNLAEVWLLVNSFIYFFFVENCRDLGWQQRYARFCGRIIVLSVLVLLLYPFLWVWTVIGTLWFSTARGCVSSHILYMGTICITMYSEFY